MKRFLVTCLCAAIVILVGCELAPPGSTPSGDATDQTDVTQEQRMLLEDIRTLQQQTGQNLQALVEDAQQRAARERSAEGLPGIVEDIMAAQVIISDATDAAQLEKATEAAAAISRLRGIAFGMLTETSASVVQRHCERALAYLSLSTPRLDEAAAELTTAYDVTAGGPDSAGVQTLLDQAKTHLNRGDDHNASKVIGTIIDKTSGEESVVLIEKMLAGLDGATAALDRQAWPVVSAELQEVRRMLDNLALDVRFRDQVASIQPAPAVMTTPTADATATATEGTATGEATPTTEPATETSTITTPTSPATEPATEPAAVAPTVAPEPAPAPTAAP